MIKAETRLKAWGNSIGVIIPKDMLVEENLFVNEEVEVTVSKKANPLKEAFGKLKGFKPKTGKSKEQLLKEIDKEFQAGLE